ncbi:hypothetical protein GGQ85_004432 [Nitrobacter vulgaris]|nr:hypothetical protein [Nitrobacter vulgaris]
MQISHLEGQWLYPLHTIVDCAFADRMPPNKQKAKIMSVNMRFIFLLLSPIDLVDAAEPDMQGPEKLKLIRIVAALYFTSR